ncbi:RnlB antitoxin of RnlAB toxin-antitoxin system [Cytobacillus oceanisediminis]|uniref:RnlB antitoxin of RnlAB toxin-antitoxin system n=1 Tax=Cytobacillus oceanisediminis TaxID=665099 RepID=A0A2V2ZQK3_9BACI|nr:type II toxin-antitoxin system RnlB family antitoxin [Cytobacillus oceanisediminis]PWW26628.1 RnlB antitoxin of RnlAB toxin-antitoxin system [Cytobacillus oceanisediminis]
MKNYEIQKVDYHEYPYVIFSTSYVNPIEDIDDIEEELKPLFKGKVVFDLLLSNGFTSNRFVEAEFDGTRFNHSSFKALKDVNDCIIKEASHFYSSHSGLLKNGILSNAHQFLIKKGKM